MWFLQSNASFCHGDDRLGAYADLLGAMEFPDYWLVSCSDAFTFFVINFEWPIGNSRPIEQLVRCGSELCIESSGGFLPFDMDSLEYEQRAKTGVWLKLKNRGLRLELVQPRYRHILKMHGEYILRVR